MKKQVFLSLTLLLSLAGCKDKKKPKKVAQHVDVFSSVEIPLAANTHDDIEEDTEVLSFFDEELGQFSYDTDAEANELNISMSEENKENITWAQTAHEQREVQTLYFGFNKYGLAKDQRELAKADAEAAKALLAEYDENAIIVLEGHACHSAGAASYNMGLSEKRAKYVRDLLVAEGVDASRIRIVGRGQEMPAIVDGKPVTGSSADQWLNRRVEIQIIEA